LLGESVDKGNGPYTGDVQRGNLGRLRLTVNLWTITVGGSYQLLPKTKLSASYWYFGTSEDVPVALKGFSLGRNGDIIASYEMDNEIGHEFDVYLEHEIVDSLKLTLVGAYLVAGDAFCPVNRYTGSNVNPNQIYRENAEDAYEVGAVLQWNF